MMNEIEKVQMLRVQNKQGASLLRHQYESIVYFILSSLDAHPKNRITLNDLIEKAHQRLDADFHGDVSWYFLQVKQDMEARKLIKTAITKKREQFIQRKIPKKRLTYSYITQIDLTDSKKIPEELTYGISI